MYSLSKQSKQSIYHAARLLIGSIGLFLGMGFKGSVLADTPFICSNELLQVYGTNGRTAIVDLNNHTLQNLPNTVGEEVNGFGYRASDDFLYGFSANTNHLIRIDATGQGTDLGAVTGLTAPAATGVFAPSGYLYARSNNDLLTINVDTRTVIATVPITGNSAGFDNFWDMGYNPHDNQLYYLANNSKLFRLDPSTGVATLITDTGINNSVYFGAQMSDANGNLVAIRNDNGRVYYIETATGAWSLVGYANAAATNDGAFCPTQYFPFADRSDAKASYGEAIHSLALSLYLGTNIDNDPAAILSANADADGNDDDGVSAFPTLTVGTNSYTIPAANLKGSGTGTLYAWVDFNGNNIFDPNEFASVPFNNGATGPLNFANFGTVMATGTTYARFRLTTDTLTSAEFATVATNGEVEDYAVTVSSPAIINCGTEARGTGSGYATGGTGLYRNDIFWLDWSCGATSQFNPGSIVRKSWTLGNGVQINAQVSNITATLAPYNSGTWSGDLLDDLYSGLNPFGFSNLTFGEDPNYTITFTATLNGVGIPADIVTADAEDTGTIAESHTVTTDGTAWQPLEASGLLNAQFSNGGKTVFTNEIPSAAGGVLLTYSRDVSSLLVNTQAGGKQALAFGVFSSFDYGDLPTGYPVSQGHYMRKLATGGSTPTTLTPISSLTMATQSNTTEYYLGTIKPDTDTGDQTSANATGDNTNNANDEDGLTLPTLTRGLATTINATVHGTGGYLQGWIDWNGNKVFDAGEKVATNLQDNAVGDTNSAAGVITFSVTPPIATVTPTVYARFRWSNNFGLDATSVASNGETEDYAVTVNTGFALIGSVFEDMNYGGGAGRNLVTAAGIGIAGARVELYNSAGSFISATSSAANGSYSFTNLLNGNYYVRVVNDTVNSSRAGTNGAELGVQTFRTNGTTPVTNEVGGRKPAVADAAANTTNQTLNTTTFLLSGGGQAQSVQPVTIASAPRIDMDFGFNFDTIVNTNNSGQGSLRQFILNSNQLANTGLVQNLPAPLNSDYSTGDEVSIFMIPNTALNGSGGASGSAVITLASALPTLTDAATRMDGRTQTINIGDTGSGQIGSGGSVGVDGITLPTVPRAEIAINAAALATDARALDINAGNITIRNIAMFGGNATVNAGGGLIGVLNGSSSANRAQLTELTLGALPNGSAPTGNLGPKGVHSTGSFSLTNSYIAHVAEGVKIFTNSNNILIEGVEINDYGPGLGTGKAAFDAIAIESLGAAIPTITIRNSYLHDARPDLAQLGSSNAGIEVINATGVMIENNTILRAGFDGIGLFNVSGNRLTKNIIHNTFAHSISSGAGIWVFGNTASNNLISQNSLAGNAGLGIDLNAASLGHGVSLNDANDSDAGANALLNFPQFTQLMKINGQLVIAGCAPAGAVIELFEADVSPTSASGIAAGANQFGKTQDYGEGERYLLTLTEGVGEDSTATPVNCATLTDADGNSAAGMNSFQWTLAMPSGVVLGDKLTATATSAGIGTSEFSAVATLIERYDHGDAPSSYGDARHTLPQLATVYLGNILPDVETSALNAANGGTDGTGDDTTDTDDENGIANFPTLSTGSHDYSLNVLVNNTSGSTARLVGWIDFNGNGIFDSNEAATTNIANATNNKIAALTWKTLPAGIQAGATFLRLRLTTDSSIATGTASTSQPTGTALNGEVEDYPLTINNSGFEITGKVYQDTNVNGANNTEAGLKNVTIVLYDTAANTCRSTRTTADGSYRFSKVAPAATNNYIVYEAAAETLPAPSACPPVEADPNSFLSTTANSLAVTVSNANVSGVDFGDVKLPQFTLEHSQAILPGSTVTYPHQFTTSAAGTVSFSLADLANPANLSWEVDLFIDTNCNAKLEGMDIPLTGSLSLNAGEKICLLAKVLAPANASSGASYTLDVISSFTYGDGSLIPTPVEQTRTDLTRTNAGTPIHPVDGAGKLKLSKLVWNVTRNINGDVALPGETLRYTIAYENIGNGQLDELIVYDRVPEFTQLVGVSQQCGTTPPELTTCTPTATGEALEWSFVGQLPAGSQGEVFYEVIVE